VKVWVGTGSSGQLLNAADANVSVFDHGLTVADGVFETLKVTDGVPFAVRRHLDRLDRSAEVLGLPLIDHGVIRGAIAEVINTNSDAAKLGRLRITLTAGAGPLGSDRGPRDALSNCTLIVALVPMQPWPDSTSAVIVPWVRNERSAIAGAKSTSYAENVVALSWAKERGYSEGVFLNTVGQVCEGTGTNVFAVIDGTLVTPPLSSGALSGITRELVVEWCDAREEHLTPADMDRADEIFLTSSTRDVHPVFRWNERQFDGRGNVTERTQSEFFDRSAATADP
jgi:branched-chain amino acid aminotransferase